MIGRRRTGTVAPPPLAAGDRIAGHRVERVLARGPERTLAEGTAPDGRRVALEVVEPAAASPALRARVARLAALREAADAPLAPVLAAGEEDGRLFVARAVLAHGTLADRLRSEPPEPAEALRLLGQVAGALETLSAFGLPHGLVTAERVLITPGTAPRALLAAAGSEPPPGRACERPDLLAHVHRLAPEVARGAPCGPAASVYALASLLVECLTGAPPFPHDPPLLVLAAQVGEPPPRVSERRPDLPAELDAVVATALSRWPEQRQHSPVGLMKGAARALGVRGAVPVARPPAQARARGAARPARPARPRPSRLRLAPAAGLVLALGLSTAGFAAGDLTRTEGAPPPKAAAPDPAAMRRAAYVARLDRVLGELDRTRGTAARQLHAATTPREQARAAAALAASLRRTRAALPEPPATSVGGHALAARLRAVEGAYERLVAAARRRDRRAYRAAAARVGARERALTQALRRI